MNPFDYLNAINDTKQDIIGESDNPELAEKLYPPYLVNKGLSYFIDTIYLVNEMNQRHHLEKKLQFDFLINIVRKKKRYSKWFKPQQDDVVDAVMNYYGYSQDKARQVVNLLTEDQITQIKTSQSKGGINGGINRNDG
tara:strand:- start:97 stop:510 length:414 start_codon:yes stop_codon:yes gene_type:complete